MKNTMRRLLLGAAFVSLLAPAAALAQSKENVESKTWNWSTGDAKTMSAYINGRLELRGKKDLLQLTATGSAGANLFGKKVELLNITGQAGINNGTLSGSVKASVAGISVYNISKSQKVKWEKSDTFQKSIDASTNFPVTLLAIPLNVKLGVKGSAGVKYGFAVTPISAKLTVTPFIKSSAYAQVSIDILVASAGAGANLTILNDDLDLSADLYIAPGKSGTKTINLYQRYSGINTLKMLDGRVYVFAEVNYYFGSKRGELELFSWKGINTRGTLFDVNKTITLLAY